MITPFFLLESSIGWMRNGTVKMFNTIKVFPILLYTIDSAIVPNYRLIVTINHYNTGFGNYMDVLFWNYEDTYKLK